MADDDRQGLHVHAVLHGRGRKGVADIEQRSASLARITSEQGILLRMKRPIQSEGAFGVIKQDYGLRQFLLHGQEKVTTEKLLLAFA